MSSSFCLSASLWLFGWTILQYLMGQFQQNLSKIKKNKQRYQNAYCILMHLSVQLSIGPYWFNKLKSKSVILEVKPIMTVIDPKLTNSKI